MKGSRRRMIMLIVVICIATISVVGTGLTGAYFSDTKEGAITGTLGSIKISAGVNPDTGGTLDLAFTNLLPGEPQSVTVNYQNTGRNPQDVWIVFPNAEALHALNDLGTFGQVRIMSNGTEIFGSDNLNDHPEDQGGLYTDELGTITTVRAVPKKILLASNVAPGVGYPMSFSFAYPGKMTGGNLTDVPAWNYYPLGSYTKNGLPYKIVATQVGQQP